MCQVLPVVDCQTKSALMSIEVIPVIHERPLWHHSETYMKLANLACSYCSVKVFSNIEVHVLHTYE
jgi:DNA-directed RNA polymerase subunit RPC12/RpoP